MLKLRPAVFALISIAAMSCNPYRFGPDGKAKFPLGSPSRKFFDSCSHNTPNDTFTWFCDTTTSFELFEKKPAPTHDEQIELFIKRSRYGKYVGKKSATLEGELAGMALSALGFEDPQEQPDKPETKGLPPFGWVTFFGTQTMPDGTGVALSCTIAAEYAGSVPVVRQCHSGLKYLRDVVLEDHKK